MDKMIVILAISVVVFVSGCTSDQNITECADHTECSSGQFCLNNTCISNQTLFYCEQDNDCVKMRENYCGCTAGGSAITINRNYSELWETQFSRDDIICPGVISTHVTCFAQLKCRENTCVFDYEDSSICENFGDYCYFRFAIQNNDIALCEKIESAEPNFVPSKVTCREELEEIK